MVAALISVTGTLRAQGIPAKVEASTSMPESIRRIMERRFVAYSPAFGERFRLDPGKSAEGMAPGLEAIEIGFDKGPVSGWIRCYVALYVASTVDVGMDLGLDASRQVLEPERHFFLRPGPDGKDRRALIPPSDAQHLLDRQARYFQRGSFATLDFDQNRGTGGRDSFAFEEQVTNLFEKIHYLRTRGCMSSDLIAHGAGVQVMLRRPGAPDYSRMAGPAPWTDEQVVRLSLPKALLEEAQPSLKAVEVYMQEAIARYDKSRGRQ
jgi:hypothetical protein